MVLGGAAESLQAALAWRAEIRVRNPDPERGLASSLQVGVRALGQVEPPIDAAVLLLGDQPRVRRDVIAELVAAAQGAAARSSERPIVAPRYARDAASNPVVLLRAGWPLIDELEGDRGLGPLIAARPELVTWLPVAGSNPDVDTPADLLAIRTARGTSRRG